ncbi:uncharacterized protein LOC113871781 [Abrus precatorius]|uniref:Uncharacterized protein LOC113871781 n=1 Tax=Abrus precatorius TaxID=3816 RepID=A0A8B8M9M4_ABRPR|nr:uncharacterized protein LOC113871781 [Abrus precatorius]
MSMLHSFFNKAFKASKCATLLKLTIPRIKLLRNRREVQLKHMRHNIAKLLEAGQEATAHVKVEHVMREENMMAAHDIIQLFCELILLRLPIVQSQRECPHDLKEAMSSICFAAPRCADLPELMQVQLLFATKYGKEFVSSATELTPDCGVNRQLIELLSVQTPSAEKKMKLLKEVAAEHKLDWDPTASETEFFKNHDDLLNGPTQFSSESNLPLHKEHPKVSVWPSTNVATASEVITLSPAILPHELDLHPSSHSGSLGSIVNKDKPHTSFGKKESKKSVPFLSRPSISCELYSERCGDSSPPLSETRTEANVDLQDVLAAAHAAAETAEHAAAAARSAASLAEARISKLTKKNNDVTDSSFENPFYEGVANKSKTERERHFTEQNTKDDSDGGGTNDVKVELHHASPCFHSSSFPSFDTINEDFGPSLLSHPELDDKSPCQQPKSKRLPSMNDESSFSYCNLFTSQDSNIGFHTFR